MFNEPNVSLIQAPTIGEGVELLRKVCSQCYNKEVDSSVVSACIKKGHTSIAEHLNFTFAIDNISRACLAQLTRHRIASYTVRSQRYCEEEGFNYYLPESIMKNDEAREQYDHIMEDIDELYQHLRKQGIPKEDARMILPNACGTHLIMTINLRSLINFFRLRMDVTAQKEIRVLAIKMFELVCGRLPEIDRLLLAEVCK